MGELTTIERDAVARIEAGPMLGQVMRWSVVNSGTGNPSGLATMAGLLADAFSALPGDVVLVDPAPADRVEADGRVVAVEHGRHLRLSVRPDAPVRMLFTGHMDTVYPADHPFQQVTTGEDGTINGPGTADMKGGLAVMLAALKAVEASPLAVRIGYDVMINSDEETGSLSSAPLIA